MAIDPKKILTDAKQVLNPKLSELLPPEQRLSRTVTTEEMLGEVLSVLEGEEVDYTLKGGRDAQLIRSNEEAKKNPKNLAPERNDRDIARIRLQAGVERLQQKLKVTDAWLFPALPKKEAKTVKLTQQLGKKTAKLTQQLGAKTVRITQRVTQNIGVTGPTQSLGTQPIANTGPTTRIATGPTQQIHTGQTARIGTTQQIGATGLTIPLGGAAIGTGIGAVVGATRRLKTRNLKTGATRQLKKTRNLQSPRKTRTIYQGTAQEAKGSTVVLTQRFDQRQAVATARTIAGSQSRVTQRAASPTVRLTTQLPQETPQVFVAGGIGATTAARSTIRREDVDTLVERIKRESDLNTKDEMQRIQQGAYGPNASFYSTDHAYQMSTTVDQHFTDRSWIKEVFKNPEQARLIQKQNPNIDGLNRALSFQDEFQSRIESFGASSPELEADPIFRQAKGSGFVSDFMNDALRGQAETGTPFSEAFTPERLADFAQERYANFITQLGEDVPQLRGLLSKVVPGARQASQAATTGAKAAGTAAKGAATAAGTAAKAGATAGRAAAVTGTTIKLGTAAAKLGGGPVGWVLLAAQFIKPLINFFKNFGSNMKIMLKRAGKALATIGLGFLAAGFALGNLGLGAIGGVMFGLSLAGGGPALMFNMAMAGLLSFFAAMGAILMPLLTKLVLFTIGGIIAFVALTMFIINTGGYLTPASISLVGTFENPGDPTAPGQSADFFRVTKSADNASLNVADLPRTITFSVAIDATQNMSNITFQNNYTVTQNPRIAPAPQPTDCRETIGGTGSDCYPNPPSTITAGQQFTLFYSVELTAAYADAMVCDTFTVTATNPSGDTGTASSTYCVSIGDPDLPPGACGIAGGGDITEQLAARVPGGIVRLLSANHPARSTQRRCITPTMIVMHWNGQPSGYEGTPNGNDITYAALNSRGFVCQLASDTNDIYFMQPFFERQVEQAWCATTYNAGGISVEMSGNRFRSSQLNSNIMPNSSELNRTYELAEELMRQYSIPWCQIYGHFEVPGQDSRCGRPTQYDVKYDPGDIFLYDTFIPEMARRVPSSSCGTVQQVVTARRSC